MNHVGNWLYWFFGISGTGPHYAFWSGAGSDITELAILGAIVQAARHMNCHSKGCWRFGKPVAGTPYRACFHHHPAHEADTRNVPAEVIAAAHASATVLPIPASPPFPASTKESKP